MGLPTELVTDCYWKEKGEKSEAGASSARRKGGGDKVQSRMLNWALTDILNSNEPIVFVKKKKK